MSEPEATTPPGAAPEGALAPEANPDVAQTRELLADIASTVHRIEQKLDTLTRMVDGVSEDVGDVLSAALIKPKPAAPVQAPSVAPAVVPAPAPRPSGPLAAPMQVTPDPRRKVFAPPPDPAFYPHLAKK